MSIWMNDGRYTNRLTPMNELTVTNYKGGKEIIEEDPDALVVESRSYLGGSEEACRHPIIAPFTGKYKNDIKKRRGWIKISRESLKNDADILQQIFADILITEIKDSVSTGHVLYGVYCDDFIPLEPHQEPPMYKLFIFPKGHDFEGMVRFFGGGRTWMKTIGGKGNA